MKDTTVIISTIISTIIIGSALYCISLAHRYTFYPVGDGVAIYRGDTSTGQADIASAKDRVWQPITNH